MPNRYFVPRSVLTGIEKAAREADIHEICCLLFGRGSRVWRAVRIPNRAPDTVMHCVIQAEDVAKARLRRSVRGLQLVGYLHTHILSRAVPSKGDVRGWRVGTLLWIYSDLYRELRVFRIAGKRPGYVEKTCILVD